MFRSFLIPAVFLLLILTLYPDNTFAIKAKCWKSGTWKFGCYGVSKFSHLDQSSNNLTLIWFYDSEFTNVPGNTFWRFRYTLTSLDMHRSGIHTIDPRAFHGLTHLRNLTLWGNSLETVHASWFSNLTELTLLDLSFNKISFIEDEAFNLLPNLQDLYIDSNNMVSINWNLFGALSNLKRARIGKNPWNWWYRAQLSRQLDNQHVDYSSEWDDYDWINHVVWNCMEKHQGKYEDDSVLDCASAYLIEERSRITSDYQEITQCATDSKALYDCAMRSEPMNNITITPKIAVRKILQGLIGAYSSMRNPESRLSLRWYN